MIQQVFEQEKNLSFGKIVSEFGNQRIDGKHGGDNAEIAMFKNVFTVKVVF